MRSELDPTTVMARLAELRRRYVPETIEEARARLARERPTNDARSFAETVQHRLDELRALCELAAHLHRR